jgi:hypothetical protein
MVAMFLIFHSTNFTSPKIPSDLKVCYCKRIQVFQNSKSQITNLAPPQLPLFYLLLLLIVENKVVLYLIELNWNNIRKKFHENRKNNS